MVVEAEGPPQLLVQGAADEDGEADNEILGGEEKMNLSRVMTKRPKKKTQLELMTSKVVTIEQQQEK